MESNIKALMTDWDYDQAVKLATPIIRDWKKRTVDMARILYVAREKLSNSGFRSDLEDITPALEGKVNMTTSGNFARGCKEDLTTSADLSSGCKENLTTSCHLAQGCKENITRTEILESGDVIPTHSFQDFCDDIGLPYRTAKDWLACYDPDKDYLLEKQEYKEARQLELDSFYGEVERKRKTDSGFVPTDIKLKWNRNIRKWSETKYQKWLQERDFGKSADVVSQARDMVVSRDARITEFGLWSSDYIYGLAIQCSEITHSDPERFSRLVSNYGRFVPSSIPARDFMRLIVIAEATFSSLTNDDRMECRRTLANLLVQDVWNKEETE